MMPGMRGAEFLEKSREITPDSIRMVLSGYAEIDSAIDAINLGGAFRYISKPWNDADIISSVKEAFARYNLQKEHDRLEKLTIQQNEELNSFNSKLEDALDKRTQDLAQTKKYVVAVLHSIAEGIAVIDQNGTIQDCNEAFLAMYGYTFDEVKNMELHTLSVDDETERMISYIKNSQQGDTIKIESIHQRKDGSQFPIEATTVIMHNNDENHQSLGLTHAMRVMSIRDTTNQKQNEQKIKDSLEEKAVLLREIYHRVKNNMQVIASMLKLQARYIDDDHYADIFHDCEHRIQSMALVHEKLYRSKDLDKIELRSYLKTLIHDLFESYGVSGRRITLSIHADELFVSLDTAIPVGLITNELISNTLKYAFPENRQGTIDITLKTLNEEELFLQTKDNGAGMKTDFDISASNSLGLKLVRTLTRQLQGSLEFNGDDGTEFNLTFKDIGKK
jgi:PAS domain S-box-containing protein